MVLLKKYPKIVPEVEFEVYLYNYLKKGYNFRSLQMQRLVACEDHI